MSEFLIRIGVYAVAIWIVSAILPGITLADDGLSTLLVIGLVIGLVNAFIKPLVKFLTCPFVLLTMGLFTLCINGLLLQLSAWLVGDRLSIDNLFTAFLGGILMAIVTGVLEWVLNVRGSSGKRAPQRRIPR